MHRHDSVVRFANRCHAEPCIRTFFSTGLTGLTGLKHGEALFCVFEHG
jgi:hypothetical protein